LSSKAAIGYKKRDMRNVTLRTGILLVLLCLPGCGLREARQQFLEVPRQPPAPDPGRDVVVLNATVRPGAAACVVGETAELRGAAVGNYTRVVRRSRVEFRLGYSGRASEVARNLGLNVVRLMSSPMPGRKTPKYQGNPVAVVIGGEPKLC
jgi:hypothetical protein